MNGNITPRLEGNMPLRSLRTVFSVGAVFAGSLVAAGAFAADPLVDSAWLNEHRAAENVVILDIRSGVDGGSAETFAQGHIPGALYSNYLEAGWRTTVDGVPGMLPQVTSLETLIGDLGIDNDTHVVVVPAGTSSSDFGSAARVYWTFKVLGHDEVSVLEGGYAGWVEGGYEVATGTPRTAEPTIFAASFRPELLATTEQVSAAIEAGNPPLIDARPVGHYTGEEVPGNIGVPGTLPGAISVPHTALVINEGRTVIDRETLVGYLAQVGLTADQQQIAFCNTGHWAAVGWFLLSEVAGNPNVSMYDGSMAEWVTDDTRLIELGADRRLM